MEAAELARHLISQARNSGRFLVAIAGPPASGKSTIAVDLRAQLEAAGETAIVVPMDGFHFDDAILNARGDRPRKGAPHTFDVSGFAHLIHRIKLCEPDIAIGVFDRTLELTRAGADIIDDKTKFILIEGNYLLLNHTGWKNLHEKFDYSIFIKTSINELEQRLIARWLDHGFDLAYAKNWIASNDLLNIKTVIADSVDADLTITQDANGKTSAAP